jgi:hypothetical protein
MNSLEAQSRVVVSELDTAWCVDSRSRGSLPRQSRKAACPSNRLDIRLAGEEHELSGPHLLRVPHLRSAGLAGDLSTFPGDRRWHKMGLRWRDRLFAAAIDGAKTIRHFCCLTPRVSLFHSIRQTSCDCYHRYPSTATLDKLTSSSRAMNDVFATGSGLSLRLGIITLLLAYVIYAYIERRKEYEGR